MAQKVLSLALRLQATVVTARIILGLLIAAVVSMVLKTAQGFGATLLDMPTGVLLNWGKGYQESLT